MKLYCACGGLEVVALVGLLKYAWCRLLGLGILLLCMGSCEKGTNLHEYNNKYLRGRDNSCKNVLSCKDRLFRVYNISQVKK